MGGAVSGAHQEIRIEREAAAEPTASPFVNRELSWLGFNRRVFEEAQDPRNPLLERVKFLAIVDSNLAEFYEVRVAGLRQQVAAGVGSPSPDGLTPAEQLRAIDEVVRAQVREQYALWNQEIKPALAAEGIQILPPAELGPAALRWLRRHVESEILPILSPISLDPAHPLPTVVNRSLNIAALVETDDPEEPDRLAIVQVPRVLPRIVPIRADGAGTFVLLADVVRWILPELFWGVKILDHTAFRVTRNSNLYLDEDETEDLLAAVEMEVRRRRRGNAVRLEVRSPTTPRLRERLLEVFDLGPEELFEVDGPVNLSRLMELLDLEDREQLRAPRFLASLHPALREPEQIFSTIRSNDVLLHHPFDSFDSVVDLVERAAEDPRVLSIKQTLYRTTEDSPIAQSLLLAAERGKQVTVVVELKARFDEEKNIRWARRMEDAGVQIVYGLVGLKTHCKLLLISRREDEGLRRYCHVGTGNYNPVTARQYTDFGLLSADPELCADVGDVFNLLTSLTSRQSWRQLLVAPFSLKDGLIERIHREVANARAGRPASIRAKLNAIEDPEVVEELYAASRAGVPIDLIVRGICCLRPGVPGLSENIRVRSIVDRFLEHTRLVRFENDGDPELWIGSADWMRRNLRQRVEVLCRVRSPAVSGRLERILDLYLRDDLKAREILPDGSHRRCEVEEGIRAQEVLMLGRGP
jgi:polyphosphate kinase